MVEMAGVQRTPPKTPKLPQTPINNNMSQTQSEPDINAAIIMSDYVNTNRNKRPRQEHSPQGGSGLSSQDLDEKLSAWKKDQDSCISKILTQQTSLMSKLVSDIGEIKSQNTQIQASNVEIRKSNDEIVQSMLFMNKKFEDMKTEVEDLRKERQEQQKYIAALEQKIIDLQHRSRSSGIELRNIPLENNENNASLTKTVCSIGAVVGVPINESEVRDIYRLPGKSSGPTTTRPIIAEFTTVKTKQTLISAVRSYNKPRGKDDKMNTEVIGLSGKRQPVYIAEQLPAGTKKLFFLAREFSNKNAYKYCWISNGNIFLRKQDGDKQILINAEKCLQELGTQIM